MLWQARRKTHLVGKFITTSIPSTYTLTRVPAHTQSPILIIFSKALFSTQPPMTMHIVRWYEKGLAYSKSGTARHQLDVCPFSESTKRAC
jgi:hypothetical protein